MEKITPQAPQEAHTPFRSSALSSRNSCCNATSCAFHRWKEPAQHPAVTSAWLVLFSFLKILFIYCQREGKGGGKRGRATSREKNIVQLPLIRAPTGDQTRNPGMHPDQKLNQWPFALRGGTKRTKPWWPGLAQLFLTLLGQGRGLPPTAEAAFFLSLSALELWQTAALQGVPHPLYRFWFSRGGVGGGEARVWGSSDSPC